MNLKFHMGTYINNYRFEFLTLSALFLYLMFCLTPSSYGLVLNMFGMSGEGLFWGEPRPIRSDEWAVWTPYLQALVNNNFGAVNKYSLYDESFRGFNALPIHDWSLFFKPLLWPFLILPVDYAFSLHHGLIIAAFLIGWHKLLIQMLPETTRNGISALFSLLLFFNSFTQGWWTTLGPLLAITPWLILVAGYSAAMTVKKFLIFFYVSCVWLLSHTYPPIIITAVYLAAILILAFRAHVINWKNVLGLGIAALFAVGVTLYYFRDIIPVVAQTIYPGQRESYAGTVPFDIWLSNLFPFFNHSKAHSLHALNICEIGVVASFLPLMVISFLEWKSLGREQVKKAVILVSGLLFLTFWMVLAFPQFIAKLILLDKVPGQRALWVFGILLSIISLWLLVVGKISLSIKRLIIFTLFVLAGYLWSLEHHDIGLNGKTKRELLAPVVLGFLMFVFRSKLKEKMYRVMVLVLTALLINFAVVGNFNPGQSAKPIFSLKDSAALAELKQQQIDHPNGWLVVRGYPGAVLQGLGFNSVSHVLMTPKLDFFKGLFPEIPDNQFNQIFNRYAHIQLVDDEAPSSPQADVVRVPMKNFGISPPKTIEGEIVPIKKISDDIKKAGYIDVVEIQDTDVILIGWGFMDSRDASFMTNLERNLIFELDSIARADVVAAFSDTGLNRSGFKLRLKDLDKNELKSLCLYTHDKKYGLHKLLPGNPSLSYQCN